MKTLQTAKILNARSPLNHLLDICQENLPASDISGLSDESRDKLTSSPLSHTDRAKARGAILIL